MCHLRIRRLRSTRHRAPPPVPPARRACRRASSPSRATARHPRRRWLPRTARAARWRDDFNAFYDHADPKEAETYLRGWCYGAKRSRLEPIKSFVAMVEAHWHGIIAWQQHRLSNGLLEGTNSLVQAAKRCARGYRSKTKMITIIYLIAGKLPLPEIHTI